MKKTVLLAVIMGLFLACEVLAQVPGDTLWTRTYGGHGAEIGIGSCVQLTTRRVRDMDIMRIDGREIPIQVSKGECVPEKQLTLIRNVIKNDFLINDDLTGGCFQRFPSIAMAGSGNFVVVWEDARKGERDIYAQRYDAEGTPQGSNFVVSDVGTPASQENPSVAMDGNGNFVVVWEDTRNGFGNYNYDFDIYAQRYDAEGNPQGSNFRVNDDDVGAYMQDQESPAVAMNGSGSFIVAWVDGRSEGSNKDIYAQIYDESGIPQDSNFIVNDDAGSNKCKYPTVATDENGNFVIGWQDERNGYNNPDIYAQMYDAIGTPQGSNFMVNDDTGTNFQSYPSIGMNNNGDFIIAWEDKRNGYGNSDIYAQGYDTSGIPQDSNFMVNDDTGTDPQYYPSIVMNNNGDFIVAWTDGRNGNSDIYAQGYDASGAPQGSNFIVNDDTGSNSQYYPSIGMDDNGSFFVAWIDGRNGDEDIYIQRYLTIGIALGLNFMVNDDVGSSFQRFPSAAMDNIGNFVVAWNDERNGNYDIYAQMYDAYGNPQGSNFMVNDVGEGFQRVPCVAMDETGNFIVVWDDNRNGNADVYAQRYDVSGNPLGSNFRVDDDTGSSFQGWPSVAMNGAGNFIIAWDDSRDDWGGDIFAQRYDVGGNPQGSNFLVNDDITTWWGWQYNSSIAIDAEGSFVIAWTDFRNFDFIADIYAQRYDENGVPQDSNFRVNDDIGPYDQYNTSIAMDNIGNFVITWQDFRNGDNPDIYAQKYNEDVIPQDSNFRVNDDVGSHIHWWPSVTMAPLGDRFVIAWTDYRNPDGDPDIVAQKFENGIPVDANVQINEPDSLSYDKQWSWGFCTACNDDIIAFTWMDTRRHKGWDMYGKVTDWELITGTDEDNLFTINAYSLAQNYPNPFNLKTTISFSTTVSDKNTNITIYNLNGQNIKTIVDKKLEAGNHSVVWDGTDDSGNSVSIGIYFYKMEYGNKYTCFKKMILMK